MAVEALFGLVFAGMGGLVVTRGVRSLRAWRHVRAGEPISIHEASRTVGPVEIEGEVRPHEETVESPFHGVECVAYEYEIERRRSGGKNSSSKWRTVDSGEERRPFLLVEGRDVASVDPEGAILSMETERTRSLPDEGRTRRIIGSDVSLRGRRRYTERRLEVGGRGYVFGEAEPHPTTVDADVAVEEGDAPVFLVSDASESATRRRLVLQGCGLTAFGGLFVAVGLWMVAGGVLGTL